MAMAVQCSLSILTPHFSYESKRLVHEKKQRIMICSSSISNFSNRFLRRDLLLSSSASIAFPSSGILAEEDLKMNPLVDQINAYTYLYPVELPSKKFLFKWVESRKPERYSSAAPLSRPPNSQFIKSMDKTSWTAKDVAESVLSDKSALRVTSTQRLAESSLLDAHTSQIDGQPYWYYEYLVRKSPTRSVQESSLYRRYIAATAERDGYLYTLNASTLNKQWEKMGPFLEKTVATFRLLPATDNYVPPFKDPWRFW
ncbi:psbP domain-containing protein 5, chloroplastic isoform X2 [Euphorbia lathyris]|uniref:psbP domain-containing protein 5, chloroplastic isoform X2 n=1 Tax=Euphorbia lathyris TaxID=212925 RepID=UPI003313B3B8